MNGVLGIVFVFSGGPELGSAPNRVFLGKWSCLSLVGQRCVPLPIGFFLGSGLGCGAFFRSLV